MFAGLNHTQRAAGHITSAIEHLKEAKNHLLNAKSDQHIHICMNLGALEEIHATMTDPECTPEIMEGIDIGGIKSDVSLSKVIPIND
jgi:hypothetical protein